MNAYEKLTFNNKNISELHNQMCMLRKANVLTEDILKIFCEKLMDIEADIEKEIRVTTRIEKIQNKNDAAAIILTNICIGLGLIKRGDCVFNFINYINRDSNPMAYQNCITLAENIIANTLEKQINLRIKEGIKAKRKIHYFITAILFFGLGILIAC